MCVSDGEGEEGGGKWMIMTDSMRVLSALTNRIEHPAGHVIHSAALGHHGNHGCGVTSLVCLASCWSREITDLVRLDIPLPLIFSVFDECLSVCGSLLTSLSVPLTQLRDHHGNNCTGTMATKRMSYSRYRRGGISSESEMGNVPEEFLRHIGKQLCHGRELAMQVAVEAIHPQLKKIESPLDISKVMSLPVVGVASHHSQVIMGVACRLQENMVQIVHENRNTSLRTLVLWGDGVDWCTHDVLGSDVSVSSVRISCDLKEKSHNPWLQTWQDVLREHTIGLLVVQGVISPALYDHCLASGIAVITQLTVTHLRALCSVSGARAVNCTDQIRDDCDVGMVTVGIVEGGWSRQRIRCASEQGVIAGETAGYYCCVKSVLSERHCDVTTAILCGHTHSQTSMLKHSLYNCLNRLQCVVGDGCVVRGGGWVEAKIAGKLRSMDINPASIPYCMRTGWLGQYLNSPLNSEIVNGFANGLEKLSVVVLESLEPAYGVSGGHYKAWNEVRRLQNDDDDERGLVVGVATSPVLDPTGCKLASWKNAFQLVRTLVSCKHHAEI